MELTRLKFHYIEQDIRSFFTVGTKPKAPAVPQTPSPAPNKRKPIVLDSDSDDDARKKPSHVANGKSKSDKKDSSKSKKRRIIESSDDDEDENQQKNKKPSLAKLAVSEKQMKPVSVSSVFGEAPIKRVEKERKPPKTKSEKTLLDDADDDVELMEIDEALLSPKTVKAEAKTPVKREKSSDKLNKSKPKEKLDVKSPAKEHHRSNSGGHSKSPSVKIETASPTKEAKSHKRSEASRSHNDSHEKESQKRKKSSHDTPSSNKKPPKKASSPADDLDTSGWYIRFISVYVDCDDSFFFHYSLRSGPGAP